MSVTRPPALALLVLTLGPSSVAQMAAGHSAPPNATRLRGIPPTSEPGHLVVFSGSGPLRARLESFSEVDGTGVSTSGEFWILDIGLTGERLQTSGRGVLPHSDRSLPRFPGVRIPGRGIVYHVGRRTDRQFGFVLIDHAGRIHWLVEAPGKGKNGTESPWNTPIAVSADGRFVVLVGGEPARVYGVDLGPKSVGSPIVRDLSATSEVDVASKSPTLAGRGADQTLFFVEEKDVETGRLRGKRLFRVPATGPGPATEVPLPPHVDEILVPSPTGEAVALRASEFPSVEDVYVVDRVSGVAVKVTSVPSELRGPDPDQPGGPFLNLSPGGGAVSYIDEGGPENELFVSRLQGPLDHVTSDARFSPSIDNVLGSTFATLVPDLFFLAGGTTSETDLYAAEMGPSGIQQVRNLTQTSGDASAPFADLAKLTYEDHFLSPAGRYVYYRTRQQDGSGGLLAVDRLTGSSAVVGGGPFAGLGAMVLSGSQLVFVVSDGQGERIARVAPEDPLGAVRILTSFPSGTRITRLAVHGSLAALAADVAQAGTEQVFVLELGSGTLHALPTRGTVQARFGFTEAGALLYGITPAGGSTRMETAKPPYASVAVLPVQGPALGVAHP